jgi:hypothetical protein
MLMQLSANSASRKAIADAADGGGFILSTGDLVEPATSQAYQNLFQMLLQYCFY